MTSQTATLHELLHRADIWRGRDALPDAAPPVRHTGFSALDHALHHGGWPAHGLTELLSPADHPGLLRLLLPALASNNSGTDLSTDKGMIILANPPARPNAAALRRAGLDITRLLILRSSGETRHLLRACLEAAASDSVSALVFWAPANLKDPRQLRRLHLAAQQGRCWLTLIRDPRFAHQSSPAPLRLHWQPQPTSPGQPLHEARLTVLKQPGGWAGQQITLPWLPDALQHPVGRAAGLPPPLAQTAATPALTAHTRPPAVPPEPEPVIYRLGTPGKHQPAPVPDLDLPSSADTAQPDMMPVPDERSAAAPAKTHSTRRRPSSTRVSSISPISPIPISPIEEQ
ncbi:hypothetical protein K8B33_12665 [Alcanivorax sp. JB21]|uniref:hypothetical protein n=1 Tax=Alcanivorax limicola TaxID=2874102 RepID=UPI001CBB61B0|nr:hypothetical protein [Alcanivorax limicola]MBZ2189955.1 hypothetical protein [Alcanivorax limicola]